MSITLWQYYQNLAATITDQSLADIDSLSDWQTRRPELHCKFMRSMGLDPLPARCDLKITKHGRLSGQGYQAEKISFQIMPDCWSTAVLFFPDPLPAGKNPAVLYLSGHSPSGHYSYQSHGIMWARRGYICLVLDTIEQDEHSGEHHGLYFRNRYDWISLGYTAAGGELWNSIRALDLLAGRPEIDTGRIGAAGNSGGGALSFFIGIADERVRAVATSCGATGLKETIADRHLMDHCDCIYFHNLFQIASSAYAALTAPRALAYCFGDKDYLFSRSEYQTLAEQTKKIYRLCGAEEKCRLFTHSGGHGYKPESISFINKWFDEHVAGQSHPDQPLAALENPESQTTIFNGLLPKPDHLDLLPELLSPSGSLELPLDGKDWPARRSRVVRELRENIFAGPWQLREKISAVQIGEWDSGGDTTYRYRANVAGMEVWISMLIPNKNSGKIILGVFDAESDLKKLLFLINESCFGHIIVVIEPRGTHLSGWLPAYEREYLRAGTLTGNTPVMLMINDILQGYEFLQTIPPVTGKPVYLYGSGEAGIACLYAAIFLEAIAGVVAENIPSSHRRGGYIPGILRYLDIEHIIGLVAPRPVSLVNMTPRTA